MHCWAITKNKNWNAWKLIFIQLQIHKTIYKTQNKQKIRITQSAQITSPLSEKMSLSFVLKVLNNPIFRIVMTYIICVLGHYVASHLYVIHCVPPTWFGFLSSPFMTLSPQCQSFRWIIYNGGQTINVTWCVIATILINKFKINFSSTIENHKP